jgi:peptidylamidoglycolate lyase
LAETRDGHVVLFTDHTANNVVVYDKRGRLVHKWGKRFPGAHGLSIVEEAGREVLFLTDLRLHQVFKTTLDGQILAIYPWPEATGKYAAEDEYRPSWTLHLPNGDFFVLDGYGKDYVVRYDRAGKLVGIWGGAEGGMRHWGPHGGVADLRDPARPLLLIAMSDQQSIERWTLDGRRVDEIPLPGGNPRMLQIVGEHLYVAHLADNWPADRDSRGFVSVLDREMRVVSNVGGSAPVYRDGNLERMRSEGGLFRHPHDLLVDREGSLYVGQFQSGGTYPLKFERV